MTCLLGDGCPFCGFVARCEALGRRGLSDPAVDRVMADASPALLDKWEALSDDQLRELSDALQVRLDKEAELFEMAEREQPLAWPEPNR